MNTLLRNLYDVIEVTTDAGAEEVLEGYLRVSVHHHPSRRQHDAPVSPGRFNRAAVALQVLRCPDKRQHYDRTGCEEEALQAGDLPPQSPDDVFSEAVGGVPPRGRPKPRDTVVVLPVPLDAFYNGRTSKVAVQRQRICRACSGSGTRRHGMHGPCADCLGMGHLNVTRQLERKYVQTTSAVCPTCEGRGRIVRPGDLCNACSGSSLVREQSTFTIVVEKGMKEGDFFTFQAQGDEHPDMQLAGDLVIALGELKHESFRRKGPHLLMSHELSLCEALTGFHLLLNHLDGRQLLVQPTKGTVISPNQLWQVDGEGMPVRGAAGESGHLVVKFSVSFPDRLPTHITSHLSLLLGSPQVPMLEQGFVPCTLTAADRNIFTETEALRKLKRQQDSDGPPSLHTAHCAHQ